VRHKNDETQTMPGVLAKINRDGRAAKVPINQPATGRYDAIHEVAGEPQVDEAVARFAAYLQSERDRHYASGKPLRGDTLKLMQGYFSRSVVQKVRVLELLNQRVANPWFYPIAKANGLQHLPDLPHKTAVTFVDVIVFNEKFTTRDLFHGLVHVTQIEMMGLDEFASLFVHSLWRVKSYFLVPLKAHAFSLDAKFATHPGRRFSVEDEVRSWWKTGRYR
jgi:hypothetical protein